jgi:hypothetical protein
MDSAWIGAVAGLAGVAMGYIGSSYIQSRAFSRSDRGVRREMRSLLRLALEQIAPRSDIDRDRFPTLWLPGFRNRIKIVVERGRQPDVAIAYDDEALALIRRAVEQLQELLHRVHSDAEDVRENIRGTGLPPSETDWVVVEGTTVMEFNITCVALSTALIALKDGQFVARLIPPSVRRVLPEHIGED